MRNGPIHRAAHRLPKLITFFSLMGVLCPFGVERLWAAACVSRAAGNWSAALTWTSCGGVAPQAADTVTISTHAVTLDVNATVAGLSFSGGAVASSLTHSGKTLTVNGTVTMTQPTAAVTSAWNINNGAATASGLITLTGNNATITRVSKIVITSGQLNANAGLTFGGTLGANATKVIDMSGGAGTLNLKGALTFTVVGTLTAGNAGSIF
jgi:hypothetical protein